jgi:hypothetical protein
VSWLLRLLLNEATPPRGHSDGDTKTVDGYLFQLREERGISGGTYFTWAETTPSGAEQYAEKIRRNAAWRKANK